MENIDAIVFIRIRLILWYGAVNWGKNMQILQKVDKTPIKQYPMVIIARK